MESSKSMFHDYYYGQHKPVTMERMEIDNKMIEDPDGKWVRYDDVKGMVEGQVLEVKSVECNCKEMFDKHACNWICPAHGYKKR